MNIYFAPLAFDRIAINTPTAAVGVPGAAQGQGGLLEFGSSASMQPLADLPAKLEANTRRSKYRVQQENTCP
ncbi:MAG: hypothetical protein A3H91_01520 [Gammaproteobacteria bacterium RIFCSPLOWO2_02_FULL_61_13]|nr:MAG: hypothetical protein A3H91_01520 [Gammaproteobacteria bacterium RIFCSPLOWO2_02_FULL_61_13]